MNQKGVTSFEERFNGIVEAVGGKRKLALLISQHALCSECPAAEMCDEGHGERACCEYIEDFLEGRIVK